MARIIGGRWDVINSVGIVAVRIDKMTVNGEDYRWAMGGERWTVSVVCRAEESERWAVVASIVARVS